MTGRVCHCLGSTLSCVPVASLACEVFAGGWHESGRSPAFPNAEVSGE